MSSRVIIQTPAITAGAYSAGDAVGGLLEFENACSPFSPRGTIISAILTDNAKQSALMHLHLFDRAFTPTADNAAFSVTDADLAHYLGSIQFIAAEHNIFADNSACMGGQSIAIGPLAALQLPIVLVDGGTSLFGQLQTGGTPTYAATDDLAVKLILEQ
jgi:hypothetical protein